MLPDYILFAAFGIPTWALVDGTWAVLSQLADVVPEGYSVSAYLILALTFGNILPLIIGFGLNHSSSLVLKNIIISILITGLVTGILIGILWDTSLEVSGSRISVPLFVLFFVVGACSSSSNVTHFTFVSHSNAYNTSALATGMGLGSMLAGLLALLQGLLLLVYGFSVEIYFIVLALLYIPAIIAFGVLQNNYKEDLLHEENFLNALVQEECDIAYDERDFLLQYNHVLFLQLMNSGLGYGVVPAIISYSCSKFNNRSLVLLLATGIAAILDPIFKALTNYIRINTFKGLQKATLVLLLLTSGLILCASLPSSSKLYQGAGGIFPVSLYLCFTSLFGFSNTCVFRYFKDEIASNCVHHSYRWSGIASQSGALIGSLLAFTIVISNVL